VEVVRTLRVTRTNGVTTRTQAFNTLRGIMIGAPPPLRDEMGVLTKRTLVNRCLRLRPEIDDFHHTGHCRQRRLHPHLEERTAARSAPPRTRTHPTRCG
jgi:hypothetical protein